MGGLPPTGSPTGPRPGGGGGPTLSEVTGKVDELADHISALLSNMVQQNEIEKLREEFDDLKRIIARLASSEDGGGIAFVPPDPIRPMSNDTLRDVLGATDSEQVRYLGGEADGD